MSKITPFLWFNDQAEEAINFYTSIFKNSKIINMNRHGDKVFSGVFELEGQLFHALNGGPMYKFNPAISLFVNCDNQSEVDLLWEQLIADGGAPGRCGWCTDKFGLSWQIIPKALGQLMGDKDPNKAQRVMQAMMGMNKIDVAGLEKAYSGE